MERVEDGEEGLSFEDATMESFRNIAAGYNHLAERIDKQDDRIAELESKIRDMEN